MNLSIYQDGISVAGSPTVHLIRLYYLLHRRRSVCWTGDLCRTAGWLPHDLLDGALYDYRPLDPEPFGWASLRLVADASACSDCKVCTKDCPMSLDVNPWCGVEEMENSECILCGTCVDNCSKSAIRFSFSASK